MYLVWLLASTRREVRTYASRCDRSLHLDPLHLVRHLHIISLSQNTKTRWAGPQPVKLQFCFLTYGSRTANRMDSLFQTVNGLVGNVDWGESLTAATCDFPGLNSFGARRRASNKGWPWNLISRDYPTSRCFKVLKFSVLSLKSYFS